MYALTKFWWISLILLMFAANGITAESELERLKNSFSNKIDLVLSPLLNRHKNSLENLEKNLANVSEVENALLVREERLRISKTRGSKLIGKVPSSPLKLRDQCQRFNREALSAIRVWEKKYEQTLGSLESRLNKLGKLNDALLVKNESIRFKRELALRDKDHRSGDGSLDEGSKDYALASNGAKAIAQNSPQSLIDGDLEYSGSEGFAWGFCPADFIVSFPETTSVKEINFLLHNEDKSREYLYQLFVLREDDGEWEMIADHAKRPSKGWQRHKFSPVDLKYIKVVGIFNSANKNFHIVEIEAR